jgi:ABC-type branched-subunit amino acid transport system substrate-binding protein
MANDHVYASRGFGDANLNLNAAATIAAYEKVHPDLVETNAYTFAGYDCAAILIDAIARAIDANDGKMPTRQQVVDQLARTTSFRGLTGTHTLNADGGPTTPTVQIQQYYPALSALTPEGGAWTPVKNIMIAGS